MTRKPSVFIVLALLIGCSTSDSKKLTWYKGNLHTHTYWSDGDEFPEMVLDWYKTNGYDFIGLSDHNTMARDEKWIVIQKSPLYETGFQKYLDKFGKDWVQYKTDTGRTQVKLKTYEEYRSKMASENFLIIPSEEITNRVNKKPVHINATNLQEFVPPSTDTTVAAAMQSTINAVLAQREKTKIPMFAHINHPNFGWGITLEDMISLTGEQFFEVYNGHPLVNNYGDSVHISTEAMWDQINVAYANRNQSFIFGLATDDSHNYHQMGGIFANAGRGWVMVQAESLRADALIAAMEAGRFYASTGVTLSEYAFENNEIKIQIAAESGVEYKIEFLAVSQGDTEVITFDPIVGTSATFKVTEEFLFARARITSTKSKPNPFQEGDVEMAWTQPVSLKKN
jgi:major membrane immunogen (membrane-anchored lipoprotein)